ncbi:hypothetical protein GCM10010264_38450 [Streptomyces globisporus]|nr:hypothetical protein GCM10010264_38450 [Streptomyces globisporus]
MRCFRYGDGLRYGAGLRYGGGLRHRCRLRYAEVFPDGSGCGPGATYRRAHHGHHPAPQHRPRLNTVRVAPRPFASLMRGRCR